MLRRKKILNINCIIKAKLHTIRKNYRNLYWWYRVFIFQIFPKILFPGKNTGSYILRERWDNLIILDACRYDVFKEAYKRRNMRGRLESRITRGSNTALFLLENFSSREVFDDIVYVTANPFVDKYLTGKFHKIISVWKSGWSEKYQTVPPFEVYKYALEAILKYPNKRLIIHFMQPHFPYLLAPQISGGELLKYARKRMLGKTESPKTNYGKSIHPFKIAYTDFYLRLPDKVHWLLYRANLEIVLDYVEKLIDFLPGTTVITADHGEAFGEKIHPLLPYRVYGHPPNYRLPTIIKVPWLIIEPDEKRPRDLKKEIIKTRILKIKKSDAYKSMKIRN